MTNATTKNILLRRPAVEARVGLGRSAIYALMAAGLFPKPILITDRAVAWVEQEVDDWVAAKIATARRAAA